MARFLVLAGVALLIVLPLAVRDVCAQEDANREEETSIQLWGNVILDYPKSERLLLEVDFEPKVQIAGSTRWRNLDVTPLVEYYPNKWIDLAGEITIGYTNPNKDVSVSTFEFTPRVGIRFHLLSNLRERLKDEEYWFPLGRVAIANLSRVEHRNFWYSDDTPSNHEWRFRNRTELKMGINRKDFNEDRTLYLITDFEAFVPLGDDVVERFATKIRTRAGLGYRFSYKWRFEGLYIWDDQRNTSKESFDTAVHILDIRMKVFF